MKALIKDALGKIDDAEFGDIKKEKNIEPGNGIDKNIHKTCKLINKNVKKKYKIESLWRDRKKRE